MQVYNLLINKKVIDYIIYDFVFGLTSFLAPELICDLQILIRIYLES
jgi:hypothetical protein